MYARATGALLAALTASEWQQQPRSRWQKDRRSHGRPKCPPRSPGLEGGLRDETKTAAKRQTVKRRRPIGPLGPSRGPKRRVRASAPRACVDVRGMCVYVCGISVCARAHARARARARACMRVRVRVRACITRSGARGTSRATREAAVALLFSHIIARNSYCITRSSCCIKQELSQN